MVKRVIPVAWTLESFLDTSRLHPADIQRDYQWTPAQVNALLEDFYAELRRVRRSGEREGFFIGTMVGVGTPFDLALYDGLQRTTTLTLIVAMLRDRVTDPTLADRLDACIFDAADRPRLTLPGPDPTLARDLQPRGATLKRPQGGRRYGQRMALLAARRVIEDSFARLPAESLERLARFVLEDVHLVFVIAPSDTMAKAIFRTTNMRGLAIGEVDLVKGRLPEMANDDDDAARLIERWDAIRQNVHNEFEGFLLAMDVLTRKDESGGSLSGLIDWMGERHRRGAPGLYPWLRFVERSTRYWNQVHSVARYGTTQTHALVPLLPVWVFNWSDWQPLALDLMHKARARDDTETWLAGQMDLLQRRCLAMELAGYSAQRRAETFRLALIQFNREPDAGVEGALRVSEAALRRVRATLRKPFADWLQRRMVLKWLEAQGAGHSLRHLRQVTVEHVLPCNPPEDSPWLEAFPDHDRRRRVEDLIGNLVLVPEALNIGLGVEDFSAKAAMLRSNQASLAGLTLARSVLEHDRWDADVIEQRTDAIGARIWSAMKLPGDPDFPLEMGADEAPPQGLQAAE